VTAGEPANAGRPEYREAAAWAAEVHGSLRRSRRQAWLAAAAATATAGLLAVALAGLRPIDSAQPYRVTVDDQRGYAQTVRRLLPGPLTRDPAVIEANLARYVIAREGFEAGDLRENYEAVALWSDPAEADRYRTALSRANPASPLNFLTSTTTLTPVIKSVSILEPGAALVRYDLVRRDLASPSGEQRAWQATLRYRYVEAAMRTADRFGNPLGFQVTSYSRSPEGSLAAQVQFEPALP
jgi:type IV secretion system protein VirB8